MTARNRELLALVPASLLLTLGFAAIFIQQSAAQSDLSLTYGVAFLLLCLAGHLVIRFTLPYADPYLFPLVAVLACFGLVVVYRIDETLARDQAQWFVVGLILFAVTIIFLRDFRVLERYRYTVAAAGLLLLLLPRVPGIGQQVNGAYLGVGFGPVTFQPAEFAKIAIVIFLAAYLRDTREVLVQGSHRILGLTLPPLKHLGPLLVVWGGAMVMLVFIRDLGSSLMFFGGFLALLYVATNRVSFVAVGLALFALGSWFFAGTVGHVQDRIDTWRDPFDRVLYDEPGGSYQIAQSLFAQADGGLFGTGFGQALITQPGGGAILPAPQTDLIYAVITNELGLAGACGLLLVYLMVVERGFKIAMLARDSFSKLLAVGLTSVFALQVFVIVGGVTKVIPLTGVTLPFVSYGGSSIVANFVLLALLLLISDRARRPLGAPVNASVVRLFVLVVLLFGLLVAFTSRWTVFEAEALRDNALNRRSLLEEQRIKRGLILARDRTVLARSVRRPGDVFTRRYPDGELFAHAVGYSYTSIGRAGTERAHNDQLIGRRSELVTAFESIFGRSNQGDDVHTTLDVKAQRAAVQALQDSGHQGALVALGVKSGDVLAMASSPSYDPNRVAERRAFAALNRDEDGAPLVNRATQNGYPPGSTMKAVTAAAALDTGRFTPRSVVNGANGKEISGVPLNNAGGENFGDIDLTFALTNSVNTVWAQVGESLGGRTMQRYMQRFGFYAEPPMDYPDAQMSASGVRKRGRLVPMTSDRVDVGRVAIGQGDLFATPLQMATVAQTIGNGGVRLKPHIMAKAVDPDGRTVDEVEPEDVQRVISPQTARDLTVMMKNVVREGTGTAAALEGVEVAGKTGTAELNTSGLNQPWFMCFTPDVAVAITLERFQGGIGGIDAAPIAKQVLEALGQ